MTTFRSQIFFSPFSKNKVKQTRHFKCVHDNLRVAIKLVVNVAWSLMMLALSIGYRLG